MTTPYKRGYALENAVRKFFAEHGFYVVRSAGSKGVFDIVAIHRGVVYGIQCKKDGRLTRGELEEILEVAGRHEIVPLLAYSDGVRYWVRNLATGEERLLREFFDRS